ncbi:hypothetical protein EDD85DRAFT_974788 [Armillaria nabsnona]|nr:hypothetical protein EDD85DRAFT_974788 [Armillaria nabsnona]
MYPNLKSLDSHVAQSTWSLLRTSLEADPRCSAHRNPTTSQLVKKRSTILRNKLASAAKTISAALWQAMVPQPQQDAEPTRVFNKHCYSSAINTAIEDYRLPSPWLLKHTNILSLSNTGLCPPSLSGKPVVVIGALGFEASKHFARMIPKRLILACRNDREGEGGAPSAVGGANDEDKLRGAGILLSKVVEENDFVMSEDGRVDEMMASLEGVDPEVVDVAREYLKI